MDKDRFYHDNYANKCPCAQQFAERPEGFVASAQPSDFQGAIDVICKNLRDGSRSK